MVCSNEEKDYPVLSKSVKVIVVWKSTLHLYSVISVVTVSRPTKYRMSGREKWPASKVYTRNYL